MKREDRRNVTRQITRHARVSVLLRALILGVALLHLIFNASWVSRWYRELGAHPRDFYPDVFLVTPFALAVAAGLLLPGRWWGDLPTLDLGGWLVYTLGYGGLSAVAAAHDQPLFSLFVPRVWFAQKYAAQPQEFLQLSLALVITCYAAFALARSRKHSYL
jgi:hypothetical protein